MLEDFKLSHLVGAFVVLTLVVIGGGAYGWYSLISEASVAVQDSYECSATYNVSSIPYPPANNEEARGFVMEYLRSHSVNVSPDSLAVTSTGGEYRVGLPRAVWSGKSCVFRDAGTHPPACIGRYFEFNATRLKMAYETPCEWVDQ